MGVVFLVACGPASRSGGEQATAAAAADLTGHPGYKLYQMYCIACHGGTQEPGQRLAPPAFMVQRHYKNAFPEDEFKQRIIAWINNPDKEKSIMPGAVRNFNLMPPLQLSQADRQQIADYFWLATFAEPAWAAAHRQQEQQRRKQMLDSLPNP